MLSAMAFRDRPGSDADFLGALAALPQSEAELRAWLLGKFGMHIERNPGLSLDASGRPQPMVSAVGGNPFPQQDEYTWVYFHLIEEKGEERAADIVSELILGKGGPRVLELVRLDAAHEDLFVRADDPELVHLMFDGDGWRTELGEYVVDYWQRSRPPDPGAKLEQDAAEDSSFDEDLEDDSDDEGEETMEEAVSSLKDLLRNLGQEPERKSADPSTGLAFIRVQSPASRFVTVDPEWKEAQLEAFILQNWENIDWGFASPLYLVGSQVQLDSESRDRVDILAKGGGGQLLAIELKIGEAKPRDVSQLLAYMTHLDKRGQGRAYGLLVAGEFPARVRNAAVQHRRVRLLKFRLPSA